MKFNFLITEKVLFPLVLLSVLCWHVYSITDYPMYFPDDGMMGSKVKTMIDKGDSMGSLELIAYQEVKNIDKIFNKSAYYLSMLPSALLGEITLTSIRAMNIVFISIILVLVFYISKEIKDWRLGVVSIVLLGFSQCFTYGTHIARHDILSAVAGLTSILIFLLNKKQKLIMDFIAGAILIFALNFHLRIVLYVPIIAALYLNRYGFEAIKSKNAWSYACGVLITGALYYLAYVHPYHEQHAALLKMTVGTSRSMPFLSLDYLQFYICLKEIFLILQKESVLFLLVFIELAIGIISDRKSLLTTLVFSTLFFTAGMMRNFYDFNAVIILPLLCIGSASFICRSFSNKFFACAAIILLCNFSYSALNRMTKVVHSGCNAELETNANKVSKIVSADAVLMGVDSFWFFFQGQKFHSWLVLNFLKRYYGWTLEQAFSFIKPDYFIADGRFFYFTRKTPGPTDWYNSYRIDLMELDPIFKKYTKVVLRQENTCNGTLVLYKFDWNIDGPKSNL